jgi:hypothetical protein
VPRAFNTEGSLTGVNATLAGETGKCNAVIVFDHCMSFTSLLLSEPWQDKKFNQLFLRS